MGTDAAVYQRVSDGTDKSVEQQNKLNERAAREHGWSFTAYQDAVSASRFSNKPRPEWDRLVSEVRRYKVVVLWEVSRGDRKVGTWSNFIDACRGAGTNIFITSARNGRGQLYDPRDATDWKVLMDLGVDSAYESEKTSLRVKRDLADAAERGDPHGRIPYGYMRRYERVEGRRKPLPIQELDPVEAPIAREIITRMSKGESISGLIWDLYQRGIQRRDGKPWAHSSIAAMVLNGVVYISKRRYNGELLDGNWPAMVDEETYWAAVNVLKDPARRTQADDRGGIRPGRARWLLSYIATCAECGAKLGTTTNRYHKGQKVPQYRCANKRASHCYAPVEWMDWLIGEAIVRWCAQKDVYEEITRGNDEGAAAARQQAQAERERLRDFEARAISGEISATSFAAISAGIEALIEELETQAAQYSLASELRGLIGPDAREADIAARWLDMPLTARRSVVRKIAAPMLAPTGRAGRLLDPFRVSPGFILPFADDPAGYSRHPLLPVPDCVKIAS